MPSDDQLLIWRQLRRSDCIGGLADDQLSVQTYLHLYLRPELQLAICVVMAMMAATVLGSPEPIRLGLELVGELLSKIVDARAELGGGGNKDEEPVRRG